MENDKMLFLLKGYEYFQSKRSGILNWSFNQSKRNLNLVSTFIETFEGFSTQTIFNYLSYHFSRLRENDLTPSKVLGKVAIQKWNNRKVSWSYYISEFYSQYGVSYTEFTQFTGVGGKTVKISELSDELYKGGELHNTIEGFAKCIEYTFLFQSTSKWCISCKFSEDCKKIKNDSNRML